MVVQDLTSFGKLRLGGPDHGRFLQGMLSADVLALPPGGFVRAALLTPRGHVAAVVDVVREAAGFLLVTEPATAALVAETLARHIIADDVSLEPVAGPAHRRWATAADVWLAPPLLEAAPASPEDLVRALRIAGGLPAWGAEIAAEMSPLEVGLERALAFDKGCYIGQELVARVAKRGAVGRRLVGLGLDTAAAPGDLLDAGVGRVTSAAVSPAGRPVALAIVRRAVAVLGEKVQVGGKVAVIEAVW